MSFLSKIIKGDPLKKYRKAVSEINGKESEFAAFSLDELKKRSTDLKGQVSKGKSLDSVLPEAFALVRETAKKTLNQRHYDVQLIGGMVLHDGKIAEMFTGEGKTLASTAPIYLNALSGKGVHVVTVNDYLAKRDTVWMGQVYHALGLSVACLVHNESFVYDPDYLPEEASEKLDKERDLTGSFRVVEKFLRPVSRKEAYAADITYGTNHQFGFDYLRDNLVFDLNERVQRPYNFAIIDEVDSILIDEARTPLIISAPDRQSSDFYKLFARAVKTLRREEDYMVDEKKRSVDITESGIEKIEKMLGVKNIYAPENARLVHYLDESLKAKELYRRDKEYVVKDGEVVIVDQFTGRLMPGRRFSGGLHQALEAKESVSVQEESRTYAEITIQNYFRMYKKIAGMTGTAQTSAEEFDKVYNLEVVSIPPNKAVIREDLPDVIYKTRVAKFRAVAEEVKKRHEKGQPILVGTASIENNEVLSIFLKKEGVPHEILNAKNHEREGEIIAQAGRVGAVTVATNMAGRGVDIVLGGNPPDEKEQEKVKELGGLHIIGTDRHEARRIDNQLRGRSGRQGDPGSSQFYLSLEDDLLRIFGGERIKNLMQTLKVPEDMPIESKLVSKAVNQVQAKVEGMNLDIRRHLLDFDDVLNRQRTFIYEKRAKFLEAGEKNEILPLLKDIVSNDVPDSVEPERAKIIAQHLVRVQDALWMDHLDNLRDLRDSVNLRAYGQKEPIVEYRKEAYFLFRQLQANFAELVKKSVFQIFDLDLEKIKIQAQAREEARAKHEHMKTFGKNAGKIGRNDPCPCGSGKKYKKCHGR